VPEDWFGGVCRRTSDERHTLPGLSALKIGHARVSTDARDLTAPRDARDALGVEPDRVYVDHGFTGASRDRPGLAEALAAPSTGSW
jgi:hypothetical protein